MSYCCALRLYWWRALSFDNAIVYDTECFPNYWSLCATGFRHDYWLDFEISFRRNDIAALYNWFKFLHDNNIPMIGFNTINYDYPMIHDIWTRPGDVTNDSLYRHNNEIIGSFDRFASNVWQSERFAPQIDLFKIHHFDNKAKIQSLKGLEFNMRSELVLESSVPFGSVLTSEQIEQEVIPYGRHDVVETKRFAHISIEMLEFRQGMTSQLKGDVLNFNDTKIGKELMAQRLGDEVCYERKFISTGFNGEGYYKRVPRQTIRRTIPLNDIIFPYIKFDHPEFNRILNWMRGQTLEPEDIELEDARATTKGAFAGVQASVNGFTFHYGTGGIHGSVSAQHITSDAEWMILDIDVASLYPSIAIVNRLYPEHLGERFIEEYAKLPVERKHWQKLKGKKCVEANSLKLAGNGTYGGSADLFSFLYDTKFTMTTTINGQLLLSMLAEGIVKVPTVQLIQANTDGITMRLHRSMLPLVQMVCSDWEKLTALTLEHAEYSDMWIRDVNNYIAKDTKGGAKLKGAYWFARNFPEDVTGAQPSAWHKDLSAPVVQRAAEAAMLTGLDPAVFIMCHTDPYDFMLRAKVPRGSTLLIGDRPVQRLTRYYMAKQGGKLRKISPPAAGNVPGQFKRKNKISDVEFITVMNEIGQGVWDARIHTANRSVYDDREISFQAGWLVAECNRASDFSFDNLDQRWYAEEARKLIIK